MYDWNVLIKQRVVISPRPLPPRQRRGSIAARGIPEAHSSGESVHANPVEILWRRERGHGIKRWSGFGPAPTCGVESDFLMKDGHRRDTQMDRHSLPRSLLF